MTSELDVDEIDLSAKDLASQFTEAHPSLIRAEGSGTGLPASTKPVNGGAWTKERISKLSPSDTLKYKNEIMTAMKEGKV